MAIVGTFGGLIFECSRRRLHTFEDLNVETEPRVAEQDVHLQIPILEFTGPGLYKASFAMKLNADYNANPLTSINLLRVYARTGAVAPLIVGGRPLIHGFNLWMMLKLGEEHKVFERDGILRVAVVDVSLAEYRALL